MPDYTFGTFQFRFDYLMMNKISDFSSDLPPYFVSRNNFHDGRRTPALPERGSHATGVEKQRYSRCTLKAAAQELSGS